MLDSSFNPPTKAHLALALTSSTRSRSRGTEAEAALNSDDKAHLLLLSVRNADKALKEGDATHVQRLEMMMLLAKELEKRLSPSSNKSRNDEVKRIDETESEPKNSGEGDEGEGQANVAVGIIDEPTFVRKSAVLREYLTDRLEGFAKHSSRETLPVQAEARVGIQLTFQMGTDTLVRLLDPKYYGPPLPTPSITDSPNSNSKINLHGDTLMKEERKSFMHSALTAFFSPPPEGQGSWVLCARRSASSFSTPSGKEWLGQVAGAGKDDEEEKQINEMGGMFYEDGSIELVDFGEFEMGISSSAVRKARSGIGAGGEGWKDMVPESIAAYVEREGLYILKS